MYSFQTLSINLVLVRASILAFLCVGAGCRGDTSTGGDGGTDGGLDGSVNDGSVDAGGDDGGESTEITLTSLHPLSVGDSHTFEVMPTGGGSPCNGAMVTTSSIVGSEMQDGSVIYERERTCSGSPLHLRVIDGAIQYRDPTWEPPLYTGWIDYIREPIEDGYCWTQELSELPPITSCWSHLGDVSVPAGNFSDCYMIETAFGTEYTTADTLCPGVGMVELHREAFGYDAVLASYEIH